MKERYKETYESCVILKDKMKNIYMRKIVSERQKRLYQKARQKYLRRRKQKERQKKERKKENFKE